MGPYIYAILEHNLTHVTTKCFFHTKNQTFSFDLILDNKKCIDMRSFKMALYRFNFVNSRTKACNIGYVIKLKSPENHS